MHPDLRRINERVGDEIVARYRHRDRSNPSGFVHDSFPLLAEQQTDLSFEQYVRAMSFHLAENSSFTTGNLTTLFDVHDEI